MKYVESLIKFNAFPNAALKKLQWCVSPSPAASHLEVRQLFIFQVYIICHSLFKNKHVWFLPYIEEIMINRHTFLCR